MPTLMIQGTSSDVGKSALVTALCRLLQRRGIAVAPFKPQTLALNSAVTIDGGEIGRAQAVQARAAGLEPHSDMNPVLLKPNADAGCQVIINGRVARDRMDAGRFGTAKPQLMQAVLAAHQRLSDRYPIVLAEGAGSPAEVNLRDGDIANMGFAEAVDCPVLLVADIERGGVFASLAGTLALLSASERQRVVGLVINRFHGDPALLQSGVDWLQQYTGKPVLGVLPYLPDLYLQGEDSLARHPTAATTDPGRRLRVVVPALPCLSNQTDLDPLHLHPGVDLCLVGSGVPPPTDLVILPGSKSVRADLDWLRQQGWPAYLQHHLRYRGRLLGICGGFQMLGDHIHDPDGLEGSAGSSDGLGLLRMQTVLIPEKQLRRRQGRLSLESGDNGATAAGYEIHMGISRGDAMRQALIRYDDGNDGALSEDRQIAGCYLHGLFDQQSASDALLQWAGLESAGDTGEARDYQALIEQGIDTFSDCVAESLALSFIDRALGL